MVSVNSGRPPKLSKKKEAVKKRKEFIGLLGGVYGPGPACKSADDCD
jgi:hypothetical protein